MMEHSPLCTRDSGSEVFFTVAIDGSKYRLVIPRELLDDECGDEADEAARRQWTEDNLPGVMSALTARTGGGWVKRPWDRVVIEELE